MTVPFHSWRALWHVSLRRPHFLRATNIEIHTNPCANTSSNAVYKHASNSNTDVTTASNPTRCLPNSNATTNYRTLYLYASCDARADSILKSVLQADARNCVGSL